MVSETPDNVVIVAISSVFSESLATQFRDVWDPEIDIGLSP